MRKNFLTLFLTLAANVMMANVETILINGLYYDLNDETKTASVSFLNANYQIWWQYPNSSYNIPSYIRYNSIIYDVTSIASYAFGDCSSLTSVTIPNSVTTIGDHAFNGCTNLTSVHISDLAAWCNISFGSDDANPLYYSHNLYLNNELITDLVIPNNVTSIGGRAFYWCTGLKSIEIPYSVTSIGEKAFGNCTGLKSITCEAKTPPTLGTNVFENVYKSTTLYVPKKSSSAYYHADQWKNFELNRLVYKIGDLYYSLDKETTTAEVTYPEGYDDYYWGSVDIPSSVEYNSVNYDVTSIGDEAFRCLSLDGPYLWSVTIPNSVTSIGKNAFYRCVGLPSIEIPNSVTSIGAWAFAECIGLTSVTIPNSVTNIEKYAFNGCSSLTSATIPNSVTSIGDYAFGGCSGLTSIEIPNSVTSIGESVFEGCSSLTDVTLSNSVTTIGDYAFFECAGLKAIEIPSSVTSLGSGVFFSCTGLKSITCKAVTPPTLGDKVFFDVNKSIPLNVPTNSVKSYKAADQWKDFNNVIGIDGDDPETPSLPETIDVNIQYLDKEEAELQTEVITFHLPAAPKIDGFTFIKWTAASNNVKEGITIQAVYTANEPASTPSVYTNPSNPTQKLLRNGNIYILTDDARTYTFTGQQVK